MTIPGDLQHARAALTMIQPEPFNAEAPPEALHGEVTPTGMHYVRSNFALPEHDGTLEIGPPQAIPKPDPSHRYRRPYEGTDVKESAMQAYLDWEYGLVDQLRRDATHGFFVI